MASNKRFDSQRAVEFGVRFTEAVALIKSCISKPFRPKGVVNSAVLEAVFISIMESSPISPLLLKERYDSLLGNDTFISLISGPTTDTAILKKRIRVAKSILSTGIYNDIGDE